MSSEIENFLTRFGRWLRTPTDRCQFGNHKMGTRGGYECCRKHEDLLPPGPVRRV